MNCSFEYLCTFKVDYKKIKHFVGIYHKNTPIRGLIKVALSISLIGLKVENISRVGS